MLALILGYVVRKLVIMIIIIIITLSDQNSYVTSKVQKWVGHIKVLSDVATAQPQLAYAAFTKPLQHKWAFLMRVVPGCGPLFQELEHAIHHYFLPTIFGWRFLLLNAICLLFP